MDGTYRMLGKEHEADLERGAERRERRLATLRAGWIEGELAARRLPDLSSLVAEQETLPTLTAAVERWRESRIDVDQGTRTNDRVNTDRVLRHDPALAKLPIDKIGVGRWAQVFAELAGPYKRGTLKKSKEAFSMLYDHFGIDPNPVRDPRVKLPFEEERDLIVPLAAHVEAVAALLDAQYVLPYLVIDSTGLRLTALEKAKVSDLSAGGVDPAAPT